ncbi:uncharacterized protein LOC100680157 [Nasonia vitripennis]|uniref:F-box domain-containing protein n=1 Tax=Nasonia vitripennis TaxID=7425 RepID=A0A7M7IMY5_NASVI|nr:uncharacterized protein LOC100680157 [Nasonia vitripennis]XP_016839260.1 uncharacterized protein LOC100680157 [Nasonia vitripennis]
MFPPEIWEKILGYTEAASLIRLKTVCCMWNEIITKHLQESNAWYRQCKNDIPEKYWLMLLENSLHSTTLLRHEKSNSDKKTNYKIWLTMYRAWIKWCNVQNFNMHTFHEFKPIPDHRPSERITCCTVLGELAAVGSTEGYIRIYNLRTNQLVFRVDQYEQVKDVKLCVQGKKHDKIVLIATSICNKSRVWDITSQRSLLLRSGDVICAGYGYYCTTLYNDKIIVYDATTEDCYPTRLFIQDLNNRKLSSTKYVNMIINRNELCFLTDNGLYCQLDLKDISQLSTFLYTPDVKSIGVPKNQKVRQYYLFNPCVAFCVTERGHLGISVYKTKWQMYNTFPFLEGSVTAILFHVRILVIGLDSGDVCLFYVENESALRTINFKSKKSKRIHVASEPIVSVNIMEILGDQRLLVATKSTIYHIKLHSVAN